MTKLTPNFSLWEFQSKDGAPMPDDIRENIELLAEQLQVLRDYLKARIDVVSGYRSPAHNKAVGGAKNSYHVKGMAADIKVAMIAPKDVAKAIRKLQREGKMKLGGVKAYATFTHYDFRGKNVTW